MMIKIGVMSDLHLGYRQYGLIERELDFYNQYDKCIDELMDCDTVLIAGDIFDKPNPSPAAIVTFQNGIEKLKNEGIKVKGIRGNHTMLKRKDHISADEIFHNNYELLDTYGDIHNTNAINFYGIDYCGTDIDKFYNKLEEVKKNARVGINILLVHESFAEYCGFAGEPLEYHNIDWGDIDIVICGHIHNTLLDEAVKPVFLQPGSIERCSLTEAIDEDLNGKGVWKILIDTDSLDFSLEFVRIENFRKFFSGEWTIDEASDLRDIEYLYQALQDTINDQELQPVVSFKIYVNYHNLDRIKDFDSELENCLVINNKYYNTDIEQDIKNVMKPDGTMPTVREVLIEKASEYDAPICNLIISLFDSAQNTDKEAQLEMKTVVEDYISDTYKSDNLDDFLKQHERTQQEFIEFFDNL